MNTRRYIGFAIFAALAAICAGIVWFVMPHDRKVESLGIFLFKLLPFIFATEAIARLQPEWFGRFPLVRLLMPICFVVFFLFFVPKIFFYSEDFPQLYYHVLTLVPFIILSFTLSYRLGGGTPGNARRIAYAMLLIMVSGAEDLAFLTVNHHTDPQWATIPERWTWASHMTVRLGHVATKYEAFAFIAFHITAAILVLTVPGSAVRRLTGKVWPRSRPPQSAEGEKRPAEAVK